MNKVRPCVRCEIIWQHVPKKVYAAISELVLDIVWFAYDVMDVDPALQASRIKKRYKEGVAQNPYLQPNTDENKILEFLCRRQAKFELRVTESKNPSEGCVVVHLYLPCGKQVCTWLYKVEECDERSGQSEIRYMQTLRTRLTLTKPRTARGPRAC